MRARFKNEIFWENTNNDFNFTLGEGEILKLFFINFD